jgi:hypothetical protein
MDRTHLYHGNCNARQLNQPARCTLLRSFTASSSVAFAVRQVVLGHLAATPIAEVVAQLAVDRRASIVGEITDALRSYVDGEQWTFISRC